MNELRLDPPLNPLPASSFSRDFFTPTGNCLCFWFCPVIRQHPLREHEKATDAIVEDGSLSSNTHPITYVLSVTPLDHFRAGPL